MSYFCSVGYSCGSGTSVFTQIMTSVPLIFCLCYRALTFRENGEGIMPGNKLNAFVSRNLSYLNLLRHHGYLKSSSWTGLLSL